MMQVCFLFEKLQQQQQKTKKKQKKANRIKQTGKDLFKLNLSYFNMLKLFS